MPAKAGIHSSKNMDSRLRGNDESQVLLEQLAGEALAEHRAGKTKPLAFNSEG
jgi:hypothetical protein